MKDPEVAVLGLGAMGLPMASCLAKDFQVKGYDVSPDRMKMAGRAGVTGCETPSAAVADADIVLLVVRDSDQLETALFGENGLVPHLKKGAVVVLGSTIGIDSVKSVAKRLTNVGVQLVDAPLSGGPQRASEGDLLIVVGAEPNAVERSLPVLKCLSSTLMVVGDCPGDGQALKTINQLLCGAHIAAAAEALALANSLGLDLEKTLTALNAGAAESFMLGHRGPRIIKAFAGENAEVLSRLDIFVKDMGIVAETARSTKTATPVAAAAQQLYLLGLAQGLGAEDDSQVVKVLVADGKGLSA